MLKVWKSEEGQKQLEKILELLKSSKNRAEFQKKFLELAGKPPFKNLNWEALSTRLVSESRSRKSKIGQLWKKLPRGSRLVLGADWSDETKESFKKDWSGNTPIAEIREKYKNSATGKPYKDYQLSVLGKMLGVSRKLKGTASTQGGSVNKENPNEKLTPEQQLIVQREAGKMTVEEFLNGLAEIRSELAEYWAVIHKLLTEKKTIRNTDLLPFVKQLKIEGEKREHKLNAIRGILRKFEEWGALFPFKLDSHLGYFCNLSNFYAPEELFNLIPPKETKLVTDLLTDKPQKLEVLADQLEKVIGHNLLVVLLDHLAAKGVIQKTTRPVGYKISALGKEFGLDAQSIKTLDAIALENQIAVGAEKTGILPASLRDVETALKKDVESKTVKPFDISDCVRKDGLKLRWLCEILFGNQFTDLELLNWVLARNETPDVIIASGLIQGTFTGYRVDKSRVLASEGGLNKIETQFHSAGLLNQMLEKIARCKVFNVSSDDDWDLSQNYAKLLQLAEGKVWGHGVDMRSLSSELRRRLNIIEFYNKWLIQWATIILYQYRIKRSLYNTDEVFERIGIKKKEYRLIIEILEAKRNNFDYPKEYEKVVVVEALFGDKGKRIVTADPLTLKVGEREIQFVHNTAFSNITQYVDSLLPVESVMRNLGARGEKLPWIIADGQQERFYATYLQGHWIMNLPGLQNPLTTSRYKFKEFNTRILSSKSHRQNTFRKEPVTPGVVDLEALPDGRIRFKLWNHAIKKVIESQKDKPELREIAALPTDLQHASITMYPELEIKYLDYALYERGASRCYENGDVLHGFIYPQHVAENRPNRLVSVDSQQRFTLNIQMPLIIDAPNLNDFLSWLGNHEWGIWGNNITGTNALLPIEAYMQGYIARAKNCNCAKCERYKNMRAMNVSRIRWLKTHNPRPDKVNWPFFATEIAGYKMAITHMWQPFGGGRTPVDQQKKWLYNMATACGDIDIMFGGDKHSVWMAQVAGKWLIQMAAAAGQSGYELHRGLMSTVMFTLVEFSNKDGITVEFVPWEFLEKYECRCPFYKGKDKELELPKRGSLEYKYGKNSALIERMIDELTQYLEI